jgi:hypothetical protein
MKIAVKSVFQRFFSSKRNKIAALCISLALFGGGFTYALAGDTPAPVSQPTSVLAEQNSQPDATTAADQPVQEAAVVAAQNTPGSAASSTVKSKTATGTTQTAGQSTATGTPTPTPKPAGPFTVQGTQSITIASNTTGSFALSTSDGRAVKWMSATPSLICAGVSMGDKDGPVYLVMEQPSCSHFGSGINLAVKATADANGGPFGYWEVSLYVEDTANGTGFVYTVKVYIAS